MLNLDLTYYESRYILGLGYDFSPACAAFSARRRDADGLDYATMLINPYLQQVGYLKDLNQQIQQVHTLLVLNLYQHH
jgi:hypothetical protein